MGQYQKPPELYDGLRLQVGPTSDEAFARIIQAGGRRGEMAECGGRMADVLEPQGHRPSAIRQLPAGPSKIGGAADDP